MTDKPLARMRVTQQDRLGTPVSPIIFVRLTAAQVPWHEDAAAVREALRRGRERVLRLAWVRAQMLLRLTPVERRCIELYYFEGLTYREAGEALGVNPTSVYRAVRRGVRKLRDAARRNPPRRRPARKRRRRR